MKRRSTALVLVSSATAVLSLLVSARSSSQQAPDDATLAQMIAQGLIAACPLADPGDEAARDRSTDALADFALLRNTSAEPVFWGAHTAGAGYEPQESNTTEFNPLVWRKMYLSLYMFPGPFQIETAGPYTLLHLPARFRNRLDMGAFPYPFWHSAKKWTSYQRAREILLVLSKGKVLGGYRSEEQDPTLPFVDRKWDGKWHWSDGAGQEMPFDSLYRWLFTPANPHVASLDAAYRALEAAARPQNCVSCHSPDNRTRMKSLVLLTFPNQALSARHSLVTVLERNVMPPGDVGEGPWGIADETERQKLIVLAKAFADEGDQALAYDQEIKSQRSVDMPTLNDVLLALKLIDGTVALPADQKAAFDLDRNGVVDVRDVILLLRQALGL